MSTESVSPTKIENTRKVGARFLAEVLQHLALTTQDRAADCMGIDASTLSRFKAEHLERACQLLAAVGLQVAPLDAVVVDREDLQAFKRMAFKYLQSDLESDGRN